jgi:hypothetical protein
MEWSRRTDSLSPAPGGGSVEVDVSVAVTVNIEREFCLHDWANTVRLDTTRSPRIEHTPGAPAASKSSSLSALTESRTVTRS